MGNPKDETTNCESNLELSNAPSIYTSTDDLPMYFGRFGGCFVAETLVSAHQELATQYVEATKDPLFREELANLGKHYIGRPTPLYHAKNLSQYLNGGQIWLKREDLCHTGAHKINNALGQALIAKRLGKERIICETGAGQHGVATATACALLNLHCTVYMGAIDMKRQELNVFRMKILGATVIPVESGSKTLKDAVNEAIRDWVTNVDTTHYIIGSAIGPYPFPTIVRDFQSVIGREARHQFKQQCHNSKDHPDYVIACVGGGSNAIGIFHDFVPYPDVQLIGVEAGGSGIETGKHSASLSGGSIGVLHGTKTFLLQDKNGQILETHSISAGLDYAGVGPEHAMLQETGRVKYEVVNDKEALEGFQLLCKKEGIIPALESSHAVSYGIRLAKQTDKSKNIIICLSGRGDKDMVQVAEMLKM